MRLFKIFLLLASLVIFHPAVYAQDAIISSKSTKNINTQRFAKNGAYLIDGHFDLKGSTVIIPQGCSLKGRNAQIVNGQIVLSSHCSLDGFSFKNVKLVAKKAAGIKVHDCNFAGSFTRSPIKAQNHTESAIYAEIIRDSEFSKISVKGYQWGITIMDSFRIIIDDFHFSGILDDAIDFSKTVKNANYHDAVHLSNTHDCKITNISAYNCGACVLLGQTSKSNIIEGCKGKVLWDNGIYISSGNYNTVKNCTFNSVRGTGIKARGSCNIIAFNNVSDVCVGYVITGNGNALGKDEYGVSYNGYGSKIDNNVVSKAHDIGILVAKQDGLSPYGFFVTNNSITDGPYDSACISVFCNGATILGNSIIAPKSHGIVVSHSIGDESGGYKITDNRIVCNRRGIVVQKCHDAFISNNEVDSKKHGIIVQATYNSSFILNKFLGEGRYYVNGSIKGTVNHFKYVNSKDSLKPSPYIIVEK